MRHPQSRRNNLALLGVGSLALGNCAMPGSFPPAVTDGMSSSEKMHATFLRGLYDDVCANMKQHPVDELAAKLIRWQYGIEVVILSPNLDGERRVHIKGKLDGEKGVGHCLSFALEPLLAQIETMKREGVTPPTVEAVQQTILSAVYAVLMDPKYQDMTLEGYQVQAAIRAPFVSTFVYGAINKHAGEIADQAVGWALREAARAVSLNHGQLASGQSASGKRYGR